VINIANLKTDAIIVNLNALLCNVLFLLVVLTKKEKNALLNYLPMLSVETIIVVVVLLNGTLMV
jgi:hypothetical protein